MVILHNFSIIIAVYLLQVTLLAPRVQEFEGDS
jgi:hypothetical protein